MTHVQTFSIILLIAIFCVSIWKHLNLGLLALPGAFLIAIVAGIKPDLILHGFPIKLVVLILGVSFLWNHMRTSGMADVLVRRMTQATQGRLWLLPWTTCALTAVICSAGALPAAALVITLPAAIQIARSEGIRPALMGVVTIQGAGIGGFSPISPWGNLVATQATRLDIPFSQWQFFVAQVVLNVGIAIAAFLVLGGHELFGRNRSETVAAAAAERNTGDPIYQAACLVGFCAFIVLVLLRYDVGLTAFAIGALLHIAFPASHASRREIGDLPWDIILMIAGLLVYVFALQRIGTLGAIGTAAEAIHRPGMILMAIDYVGTIFANFESSSVAVLGLVMPLAMKALTASRGALFNSAALAVMAGSIAVIGASPFHLAGGLLLAEAGGDERSFRDLLIWAIGAAAVLPLVLLAF